MIKKYLKKWIQIKTKEGFLFSFFCFFSCSSLFAFQPQKANLQTDTIAARQLLQEEKSLKASGNYEAALKVVDNAQHLYAQHELWEEVVNCEIRQAKLADNFSSSDVKVKHANMAMKLAAKHLSKDHILTAAAFRQKGEALMMIGDLDSANYFLNLAIPILKKQNDWTELGWTEILLGVNFLNRYQLDACEKHFYEVKLLLQNEKIPKEEKADIQSTFLELSGVLYQLQGDYDKAIKNTKEALAIDLNKTTFLALDSFFISEHFNNLGAFFLIKGDYQRSLDHFLQATFYNKDYSSDPVLLNNIGQLFMRQEKYLQAVEYFEQSLNVNIGKDGKINTRIDALNSLGLCYTELGLFDKAMSYCEAAVSLPGNIKKYVSWVSMGTIFIKKEEAGKSLEYLNLAQKEFLKSTTASKHKSLNVSRLYYLTGKAHVLNHDQTTAIKYFQKALIANHSNFVDSLDYHSNPSLTGVSDPIYFLEAIHEKAQSQASFAEDSAMLESALSTFQYTIQWIDTLQASYFTESSQLDWSNKFKPIYEDAINLSFQLYQNSHDLKYLELAFTFSEKSKNAILLETLKSNEGKSQVGVPDSLIQKEKDLNLDIAFYEKSLQKVRAKNDTTKEKLYQKYFTDYRIELVALKEQLEEDYPKFYDWKYGGKSSSISDVQSQLADEHTAFLEYFIGENTAFVFVITKDKATLIPLHSPDSIKSTVTDFRQVLLDIESFQRNAKNAYTNYYQNASLVYKYILEEVVTEFSANIRQLIIVPDGVLNALPFEALCKDMTIEAAIDFANLPYLLYDFQVVYAYSANLLMKNKEQLERLPSNTSCLAFAPPYKEVGQIAEQGQLDQLRANASQLEGTANEIQQIAHFVDGRFDFGITATEQQFKAVAHQFGILHLAMHGVTDLENANFNYLRFSDLNKDSIEDNLLHYYEIVNMDLQAQLVVLSACETGLGKYEEGEGVFSLGRSFMYAGVPSVVMSLWKVSDVSASQMMPYFYENLSDNQSKGAALHHAKLRFLKEADLELRHPFYWSAFVIMGDAQILKKEEINFAWWAFGSLLLSLFAWWTWKKRAVLFSEIE